MTVLAKIILSMALGAPSIVHADEASPAPPEVSVEGQQVTLRQRVDVFVHGVTQNPGFSDSESLVRWNVPICLFLVGLPEEDLKSMSARLTQIITVAGASLAREPCQPNFSVIVTSDPDRVLAAWHARNKQ